MSAASISSGHWRVYTHRGYEGDAVEECGFSRGGQDTVLGLWLSRGGTILQLGSWVTTCAGRQTGKGVVPGHPTATEPSPTTNEPFAMVGQMARV